MKINTIAKRLKEIVKKYRTSDPFVIADMLNIKVLYADLEEQGVYVPIGEKKIIVLNQELKNRPESKFIMAHELFHAIEHGELMALYHNGHLVSWKKEREANQFAAFMCLIGETIYAGQTKEQICRQCYIPIEMEKYI